MQKKLFLILFCSAFLIFSVSPAGAYLVEIENVLETGQDFTDIRGWVHELGHAGWFPEDERIDMSDELTEYRPCFQNEDDPQIPNYAISITNMTNIAWTDLHYVADPETTIQNYDQNRLNGELAFRIDNVGLNTPLISESMNPDLIFEPGETWIFVMQDYTNTDGYAPSDFMTLGVPSPGHCSSGSIIALPIPEPATLALLTLGAFALRLRRH